MSRWTERQHTLLKALGIGRFWPALPVSSTDGPHPPSADSAAAPAAAADDAPTAFASPVAEAALSPTTSTAPTASALPVVRSMQAEAKPAVRPAPTEAAKPLPPRPDATTLSWPALKAMVDACQACGLCQARQQAVLGIGHTQAHWMLVGEAPGEQEDRLGEPFVGRAGQLLDRMLEASELTRHEGAADKQVYIANVIKCRPPANRNPTPEELQQCEPYLLRQVALVQPRLMVAMGRFAAHTLLQTTEPIGRLRGRVHNYHGTPLIVTYHPAYLLRNPADKALAWDDWCLARQVMADQRSPK